MLINASNKFEPLKKSKGSKRKEIDEASRLDIVATLTAFQDNNYARVFAKEFFYFNKQAILLTNVDAHGNSFAAQLEKGKASEKPTPISLSNGECKITEFTLTIFDKEHYASLADYFEKDINPLLNDSEQMFASQYRLYLPTEAELKQLLENDRIAFALDQADQGSQL